MTQRADLTHLTMALGLAALTPYGPAANAQPISILWDVHADPMGGNLTQQNITYQSWIDSTNWALDTADPRGAKISFLSGGAFMEWVLEDPARGHPLVRRLYASGAQIGTHSHTEYRAGYKNWPNLPPNPTSAQILSQWNNHVGLANSVITAALGVTDSQAILAINASRGSHLPSADAARIALMQQFGFTIHQQGPDERFFGYFGHYVMNPYRPASDIFLKHDPSGPVVLLPTGSVLGANGLHGPAPQVWQDMRLAAHQSRFLLELLNWLDDGASAGTDRLWIFGWGSHCSDLTATGVTRPAITPMLDWLGQHFVNHLVGGRTCAAYSSFIQARDAYLAWETANPGVTSFSYAPTATDWSQYPYLRPAADYLLASNYVTAMTPVGDVRWHKVSAATAIGGPFDLYVAYTTGAAPATVDLSASLGAGWIASVNPHTGAPCRVPTSAVTVGPAGTILIAESRLLPAWGSAGSAASITTSPVDTTVIAGQSVALSVTAAGTEPLTYQWRKDGATLSDGGTITGAATPTLAIAPVALADIGAYDAVVSNGCGSATSAGAVLTVVPCPADYNHDGFLDGIDYDLFNNDFESPDPAQQIHADYNGDGFVDGIDYDLFNNDFEKGC